MFLRSKSGRELLIGRDISPEAVSYSLAVILASACFKTLMYSGWNMQSLVWFASLEISFHWNGRSPTFCWDNMAFSTVISLVLALLMSSNKQSNSETIKRQVNLYVLIYNLRGYSRESKLLLLNAFVQTPLNLYIVWFVRAMLSVSTWNGEDAYLNPCESVNDLFSFHNF